MSYEYYSHEDMLKASAIAHKLVPPLQFNESDENSIKRHCEAWNAVLKQELKRLKNEKKSEAFLANCSSELRTLVLDKLKKKEESIFETHTKFLNETKRMLLFEGNKVLDRTKTKRTAMSGKNLKKKWRKRKCI